MSSATSSVASLPPTSLRGGASAGVGRTSPAVPAFPPAPSSSPSPSGIGQFPKKGGSWHLVGKKERKWTDTAGGGAMVRPVRVYMVDSNFEGEEQLGLSSVISSIDLPEGADALLTMEQLLTTSCQQFKKRPPSINITGFKQEEIVKFATHVAQMDIQCTTGERIMSVNKALADHILNEEMKEEAQWRQDGQQAKYSGVEWQRKTASLLSIPGCTPQLLEGLYKQAAEYWKAQLQDKFTRHLIMEDEATGERTLVAGASSSSSFGIAKWESIEDMEAELKNPGGSDGRQVSYLFASPTAVPFADLDDMEKHGWPLADPSAHAQILAFGGPGTGGGVGRPTSQDLAWFELAFGVARQFVGHVSQLPPEDQLGKSFDITVSLHSGPKTVVAMYHDPNAEVPQGQPPAAQQQPPQEQFQLTGKMTPAAAEAAASAAAMAAAASSGIPTSNPTQPQSHEAALSAALAEQAASHRAGGMMAPGSPSMRGQQGQGDFIPSPAWQGAKAGYVFKTAEAGTGYYKDQKEVAKMGQQGGAHLAGQYPGPGGGALVPYDNSELDALVEQQQQQQALQGDADMKSQIARLNQMMQQVLSQNAELKQQMQSQQGGLVQQAPQGHPQQQHQQHDPNLPGAAFGAPTEVMQGGVGQPQQGQMQIVNGQLQPVMSVPVLQGGSPGGNGAVLQQGQQLGQASPNAAHPPYPVVRRVGTPPIPAMHPQPGHPGQAQGQQQGGVGVDPALWGHPNAAAGHTGGGVPVYNGQMEGGAGDAQGGMLAYPPGILPVGPTGLPVGPPRMPGGGMSPARIPVHPGQAGAPYAPHQITRDQPGMVPDIAGARHHQGSSGLRRSDSEAGVAPLGGDRQGKKGGKLFSRFRRSSSARPAVGDRKGTNPHYNPSPMRRPVEY